MASRIVPGRARAEWLAEWGAELAYLEDAEDAEPFQAFRFAWGSWPDAVTVRRLQREKEDRVRDAFHSPLGCLGSLSLLALIASATWFAALVYLRPAKYCRT